MKGRVLEFGWPRAIWFYALAALGYRKRSVLK